MIFDRLFDVLPRDLHSACNKSNIRLFLNEVSAIITLTAIKELAVYIGLIYGRKKTVRRFLFSGDRKKIKGRAFRRKLNAECDKGQQGGCHCQEPKGQTQVEQPFHPDGHAALEELKTVGA